MKRERLAGGLALLALTLIVFAPVLGNGFISIDDPQYITSNPMVRAGFTRESVVWAFTTNYLAQWHPLTWLGHMANCQAFGLDPRMHLSVNLFWHASVVLAVFWLLCELQAGELRAGSTRSAWLGAAIFAVHPLQVESVSWACQLKTLYATFFAVLALIAYLGYARAPGWRAHARVTLAMVLSLCSKMMGVTLPCLFLLLDFWPLGRVRAGGWPLVREKLPWFALAAVGAVVKLVHRAQGHELEMFVQFLPLKARIAQAWISYATYPYMFVWPVRLALPYPHPGADVSTGLACAAAVAVLAATAWVVRGRAERPWCVTGWFWFLGTLVPVIGIVQVGNQAYADRFMYLPMLGLLVMIFGVDKQVAALGRPALIAGAVVLLALSLRTRDQLAVWRTNESLLEHALAMTENNALAHTNLGNVYLIRNELSKALEQYKRSIALNDRMPESYNNLGLLLVRAGRAAEAVPYFERALELRPYAPDSKARLLKALLSAERVTDAERRARGFVAEHPHDGELNGLLALIEIQLGHLDEAERSAAIAVACGGQSMRAQAAAGYVALRRGRWQEAFDAFERAREIEPETSIALEGCARALHKLGRTREAAERAVELERVSVPQAGLTYLTSTLCAEAGQLDLALAMLNRLIRREPRLADAHFRAAVVLNRLGRAADAQTELAECLRLDPHHPQASRIGAPTPPDALGAPPPLKF